VNDLVVSPGTLLVIFIVCLILLGLALLVAYKFFLDGREG
jgi:hypothetical protein